MTTFKRISLVAVLAAALAAAGCGSDDDEGAPIPARQADALMAQLDNVQGRLDNGSVGACEDIFTHPDSPNQPTVDSILTQIPQNVDQDVRSALERSFQRLWDLVDRECDKRKPDEPAEPEPDPQPEEPTETEPPAETVPPEETTPTTPPEEEELPPDGDGDTGGGVPGDGNGNGNGTGLGDGGVGPDAELGE